MTGSSLQKKKSQDLALYRPFPPHEARTRLAKGPTDWTPRNFAAASRASSFCPAMQRAKTRSAARSGASELFGYRAADVSRTRSARCASPERIASSAS